MRLGLGRGLPVAFHPPPPGRRSVLQEIENALGTARLVGGGLAGQADLAGLGWDARAFDRVGRDYLGRPGFWPEYTTNPSQGGTDSYAFLPPSFQGVLKSDLRIPATTVYTAAWDHLGQVHQTPGWESPGMADPVNLAIDYSRYYHSSGDTAANTTDRKPEAMVRAARAIGIALLRLAFA